MYNPTEDGTQEKEISSKVSNTWRKLNNNNNHGKSNCFQWVELELNAGANTQLKQYY